MTDSEYVLQVGLVQFGLYPPSADASLEDLVVARTSASPDTLPSADPSARDSCRRSPRNWCVLEYQVEGYPILRSLLLPNSDILQ